MDTSVILSSYILKNIFLLAYFEQKELSFTFLNKMWIEAKQFLGFVFGGEA